jgi:hypothetical protein
MIQKTKDPKEQIQAQYQCVMAITNHYDPKDQRSKRINTGTIPVRNGNNQTIAIIRYLNEELLTNRNL